MEPKKAAATKAITLIDNNTIVGLGAGSTIAYLVELLAAEVEKGLQVQLVTSSFFTTQLLTKNRFTILETTSLDHVDIYFDGCDQLDEDLNAIKSGGGIHTHEKLLASMADQFVLIGDDTKLVQSLDNRYPIVAEVIPEAATFVPATIRHHFSVAKSAYRISDKKDGYVITERGNYLLDVWFEALPDIASINPTLKSITGILETSLFYNLARRAIIAGKDGVQILEKNKN